MQEKELASHALLEVKYEKAMTHVADLTAQLEMREEREAAKSAKAEEEARRGAPVSALLVSSYCYSA